MSSPINRVLSLTSAGHRGPLVLRHLPVAPAGDRAVGRRVPLALGRGWLPALAHDDPGDQPPARRGVLGLGREARHREVEGTAHRVHRAAGPEWCFVARRAEPPGRAGDRGGHAAREVVGLYGDPDTSWGIGIEAGLVGDLEPDDTSSVACALSPTAIRTSVMSVASPWPMRPDGTSGAPGSWPSPSSPVSLSSGPRSCRATDPARPRLLVAVHHGVCDGLGPGPSCRRRDRVAGGADGHGSRCPAAWGGSFVSTLPKRVAEALRPPASPVSPGRRTGRTQPPARSSSSGRSSPVKVGTVAVCRALARVYRERSGPDGAAAQPLPLVFVGASRRPPGTVAPDRQTAYLRFRVDPRWSDEQAAEAFAALAPEPDFPETSLRGLGPRPGPLAAAQPAGVNGHGEQPRRARGGGRLARDVPGAERPGGGRRGPDHDREPHHPQRAHAAAGVRAGRRDGPAGVAGGS